MLKRLVQRLKTSWTILLLISGLALLFWQYTMNPTKDVDNNLKRFSGSLSHKCLTLGAPYNCRNETTFSGRRITPSSTARNDKNEVPDFDSQTPKDFIEIKKIPKNVSKKAPRKKIPKAFQLRYHHQSRPFKSVGLRKRAESQASNSSLRAFVREQEERNTRVMNVCEDGKASQEVYYTVVRSIVVDGLNEIAFCPVFKSASSSWLKIMLQMRGLDKVRGIKLQETIKGYFKMTTNLVAPSVALHMTKFIVIRHPFERLVSCYRDKLQFGKKLYYYKRYGEKMVHYFRKIKAEFLNESKVLLASALQTIESPTNLTESSIDPLSNPYTNPLGPTFEEFIRFIVTFNQSRMDDEHWRPIFAHCNVCNMRYDFLIRFESLMEESRLFLNYLNQSEGLVRWDNPTRSGPTNYNITCSFFAQIDVNLYKALTFKYELDFRLFDYDSQLYKNCTKNLSQT